MIYMKIRMILSSLHMTSILLKTMTQLSTKSGAYWQLLQTYYQGIIRYKMKTCVTGRQVILPASGQCNYSFTTNQWIHWKVVHFIEFFQNKNISQAHHYQTQKCHSAKHNLKNKNKPTTLLKLSLSSEVFVELVSSRIIIIRNYALLSVCPLI